MAHNFNLNFASVLVTIYAGWGGGGLQNGSGECEVLPLQKGWLEKVLAVL